MTNEQFDALVARLSPEATARPLWYKTRVFLLAMLGYAYVFGVLAVILAIVGGVVALAVSGRAIILLKNVALPLGVFGWVVGKALWVKLDPPSGRRLSRDEAPRLFEAMADVCAKLDAPRADVVLLADDYNAAVSQVPRLGVFGWHRNYLIVGLPLMQALPPDEWRGVLAHEFAHLSRSHARFSNWIYRVRKTWYQLMDTLERERQGSVWIFKRFFHWYAPYFGAYSFVLARRDEFEADALAATVVGPETMARGLLMMGIRARLLSEAFWPRINRELATTPNAPDDIHSRMADALRAPIELSAARAWGTEELATETGSADTHPSPRDRIAALGLNVAIDSALMEHGAGGAPLAETAADHFLGRLAATVTKAFDVQWQQNAADAWRERHEEEQREEGQLLDLTNRHPALDDDELWELARLSNARRGAETAEPYLRELLTREPRHAAAAYLLGSSLLLRDDADGARHIEIACEIDPDAIPTGYRMIAAWLRRNGREVDAQRYEAGAEQHDRIQGEAAKERETVFRKDRLLPHELDDAALAALRARLAKFDRIRTVWLVRKAVVHRPERPLYILGVDMGPRWKSALRARGLDVDSEKRDPLLQSLANTLPIPGEALVIPLTGPNAWLWKLMKKVPGARIYLRNEREEAKRPSAGSLFPHNEGDRATAAARSSSSPRPT